MGKCAIVAVVAVDGYPQKCCSHGERMIGRYDTVPVAVQHQWQHRRTASRRRLACAVQIGESARMSDCAELGVGRRF